MTTGYRNFLLSGGIGSGKSVVRRFLETHGINTIDADSVGHEVLASEPSVARGVSDLWPEVVSGGRIDRSALGGIVFSDPEALEQLEALTHPHIFSLIEARARALPGPVVVEIPVLKQPFEPAWERMVVDSDDETRIERAVERGMDRQDVLRRMNRQPQRGEWLEAADIVIPNHGTLDDLENAVSVLVEMVF